MVDMLLITVFVTMIDQAENEMSLERYCTVHAVITHENHTLGGIYSTWYSTALTCLIYHIII